VSNNRAVPVYCIIMLYNGLNIAGNEASSFQMIAHGAIVLMQYV